MIDLDAVGEEIVRERVVKADGVEYRFPGTLSVNRLRDFAPRIDELQKVATGEVSAADMLKLIEEVLAPLAGPDQTAQILDNVGIEKVQRMIMALFEAYGLGEASASQRSSRSTGKRSRPTSKPTTASTSVKPSSEPATTTPDESFV